MESESKELYYAIVWNTDLESDREIEGVRITRDTMLPESELFLYGTNENDVLRVNVPEVKSKVTYDPLSTKQTLEYYIEDKSYEIKRDLRIVVWRGLKRVQANSALLRVITPEDFDLIKEELDSCSNSFGGSLPRRIDGVAALTGS